MGFAGVGVVGLLNRGVFGWKLLGLGGLLLRAWLFLVCFSFPVVDLVCWSRVRAEMWLWLVVCLGRGLATFSASHWGGGVTRAILSQVHTSGLVWGFA